MTNKEAIEVITHFDKHIIPCDEYGYRIDSDLMEAHLMAAHALSSCWIPCSERLPEHREIAICRLIFDEFRILQWDNFSKWWLGYGAEDDWRQKDVTHWMPLPNPPEGG